MKPQLELIPHEIDGSIHAFIYENDRFDAPWHYHKDYELTYIIKSSGIRYAGNSIDHFVPGDLVFIGENVPHCWKNEKGYSNGVKSACVQWDSSVLDKFISSNIELKSIYNLLEASKFGVKYTNMVFNEAICKKLERLCGSKPAKKIIDLLDILLELANCNDKELLSLVGTRYKFSEKSDSRTMSILNYIDEKYQERITIQDMADLTFMTRSAFCKYFKKQFSRSFTNYLNEFRIRKVCLLLQDTDSKLLDLAYSCGYENMSFFHRQFKKYLAMTPTEYRKKL
ncbi:AraC family transcriptional regulator [Flavivirga eckloniae]|uniref:HTH araC/xylS-type domain-containing protein n=1 Tax=Flavivirga eckloniae TaxID=1803846 RepID=A0A2K9PV29_9FLAO|nr:AraC family transcriptional regulator [Flavivirga eckloniae]AUP80377.1 hypothetical protein C1H87_17340 [Flavivirga eckloniae]